MRECDDCLYFKRTGLSKGYCSAKNLDIFLFFVNPAWDCSFFTGVI